MRNYIRHPSDIPIEIKAENAPSGEIDKLNNISHGGLSFYTENSVNVGIIIRLKIPLIDPSFEVYAKVSWCIPHNHNYNIGVEFIDINDAYKTRMVEQICHIEKYKKDILEKEGRKLSGQEAAHEWIVKYADEFPNLARD
jgi:Tfp pilus assembly protein PilZ